MNADKKVIKYYKSFYDISKNLNKDQFYDFNNAIFDVMFFEKDIDSVNFKDQMLRLLWISIKHSLKASIEGFCSKQNIDYKELMKGVSKGVSKGVNKGVCNNDNVKGKEKGKDNVKEKGKEIYRSFDHLQLTTKEFENLISDGLTKKEIDEYCDKVENYKKNKNYKSLNLTIRNWKKKDDKKNEQQTTGQYYDQ